VVDYVIEHNQVKGALFRCIEAIGNSSTEQVVEKNNVKDCFDGVFVEDYTAVLGNNMEGSGNYGLRVNSNNDVIQNNIRFSGVADLQIDGSGNTFEKNKCSSLPCPQTPQSTGEAVK
jgi:hypothetical protein